MDRGYRDSVKLLKEYFPKAEVFIPPNIRSNPPDLISQKKKKPVFNQADADWQRVTTVVRWAGEKIHTSIKNWIKLKHESRLPAVFNGLHFTISKGNFNNASKFSN